MTPDLFDAPRLAGEQAPSLCSVVTQPVAARSPDAAPDVGETLRRAADGFDPRRLARATDPATSHEAASQAGALSRAHRERVLASLKRLQRAGAEQIADDCGLGAYETRKRLPELEDMGLAQPTDELRKTRGGRRERIWEPRG